VSLTEKGAFGDGLMVTGTVTLSVQPAGVMTISFTSKVPVVANAYAGLISLLVFPSPKFHLKIFPALVGLLVLVKRKLLFLRHCVVWFMERDGTVF